MSNTATKKGRNTGATTTATPNPVTLKRGRPKGPGEPTLVNVTLADLQALVQPGTTVPVQRLWLNRIRRVAAGESVTVDPVGVAPAIVSETLVDTAS